jgi:hypothetical protein
MYSKIIFCSEDYQAMNLTGYTEIRKTDSLFLSSSYFKETRIFNLFIDILFELNSNIAFHLKDYNDKEMTSYPNLTLERSFTLYLDPKKLNNFFHFHALQEGIPNINLERLRKNHQMFTSDGPEALLDIDRRRKEGGYKIVPFEARGGRGLEKIARLMPKASLSLTYTNDEKGFATDLQVVLSSLNGFHLF